MKYKNLKLIYTFLLFVFFLIPTYSQNINDLEGLKLISSKSLMKTVKFLSSNELKGRLPGNEGFNKAAKYMTDKFKSYNIKPFSDSGYYQNLFIEYNWISAPCKLNLIENKKAVKEYKIGKDFVCRGFTGSGHITKSVVFCGYGISRPDIGYDDYKGIDVRDKIVMVFKPVPIWKVNDSVWGEISIRKKVEYAFQHGAVGILFVSLPNDKKPQKTIGSVMHGEGVQHENFPQMHISLPVADEFFINTNKSLKVIQKIIDSTKMPYSFSLNKIIEMEVNAEYKKEQPTMNIVGIIEGSDPQLKNEYLIIGAHLDHVGKQADEILFPGANDNASGSAAVLEIAKVYAQNKIKPKRSIIFVLFTGEEQGMVGSEFFVNHLPVPVEKVIAMFNLDCIAYGDSIQIGNGKSSPKLWYLAKQTDSLYTKMMVEQTWGGGGADATPFHKKSIPCLYFVTTNSYEHLHYMTDTYRTLNTVLFEKITKLAYLVSLQVANGYYNKEIVLQ